MNIYYESKTDMYIFILLCHALSSYRLEEGTNQQDVMFMEISLSDPAWDRTEAGLQLLEGEAGASGPLHPERTSPGHTPQNPSLTNKTTSGPLRRRNYQN